MTRFAMPMLLLAACSFSGPAGELDDPSDPSDPSDPGDPGADCPAVESMAELMTTQAEADALAWHTSMVALLADVSKNPINTLEVSVWDDEGVFAGSDISTGTYSLAGEEANYDTCGVCVVLWNDFDRAEHEARDKMLMAVGGSIRLDEVENRLAGELIDVVLREVDPVDYSEVPGGCELVISAPFDADIDHRGRGDDNGGFGGGPGGFDP